MEVSSLESGRPDSAPCPIQPVGQDTQQADPYATSQPCRYGTTPSSPQDNQAERYDAAAGAQEAQSRGGESGYSLGGVQEEEGGDLTAGDAFGGGDTRSDNRSIM